MAEINLPLPISDALSNAERDAMRIKAELQDLRLVVDRLRTSASDTQRSNDLLKGIIERLPIGLTVQDDLGRLILVNDLAAARLGASPAELTGRLPADAQSQETSPSKGGEPNTVEESSGGAAGERTWLTSRKPVRVLDEMLLLCASLDITERK